MLGVYNEVIKGKEKQRMLKMSNRAIMAMEDSYTDRIIECYDLAKRTIYSNFPAMAIKEMKAIHEELCWAEEGGILTTEEAGRMWTAVEETAERLLEDWEKEIDND
jgi:hypothetical protein